MDPSAAAARLLIDGVVAVPDVLSVPEVAAMTDAFERRAAQLGKRWLDWDDVATEPAIVSWIAHPRLMRVVDAFMSHLGHEAVFANSAGIRDVLRDPDN